VKEQYNELLTTLKLKRDKMLDSTYKLFFSIVDTLKLYKDIYKNDNMVSVSFVYNLLDNKAYCNMLGNTIIDNYTNPEDIDLELLQLLCIEEGITFSYKKMPDAYVYMFDKVLVRENS
jgi:hypothetical protein